MKMGPVSAAILVLCACLSVHAQQSPPPAQQQPPFTFTKIDLELFDKCNQLDRHFEEKGMVYANAEATEYLTLVGEAVLPKGEPPENVHWRFRIVRDPIPNAFALANGSIYVNSGLLALLENEAQLAGVLAHEETHVLNRHSYLQNRSYRKKALAINILVGAGSLGGGAGGIGGNVVALVGTLIPAILVETIYGYSRELEREADIRAISAMVEADYSTEEMVNTFRLLQTSHEVELSHVYYQDHPKLQDRVSYVSELANSIHSRTAHPMVEPERYFAGTEKVAQHDVELEIREDRARTGLAMAHHLVKQDPKSSENYYVLGEAYRDLGPRTSEPTEAELSSKGKKETRKMVSKMTEQEYEQALSATPAGKDAWEANQKLSEEAYKKALELDPANARVHRGLGFLYEREHLPPQSIAEFRKYLELSPAAQDRAQVNRHIDALEKEAATPAPAP